MSVYPIMLEMSGRRAVVVGAGGVGARKAKALLEAGAEVVWIAPEASADALGGDYPRLLVLSRAYRSNDLHGAALVFACTDDRSLNARIVFDARAVGSLANAADQPEDCDFYSAAMVRRGEVVVAVSTGASAPALAAALRDRVEPHVPADVGEFADALAQLRADVKARFVTSSARRRVFARLSGEEGWNAFRSGGLEALRRLLDQCESSALD